MSFLKKPAVLIVLAAILFVSSTVLSVRVKLGNKCEDVTEFFYADTVDQKSIASLLRDFVSESQKLTVIASDYGIDTEEAEDQVSWLDMALRYNRGEENYLYSEYSALIKAMTSLQRQLDNAALNERDAAQVAASNETIATLQSQILTLASDYNSMVRSFNRRYGGFPADVMADFAGVELPEEFA